MIWSGCPFGGEWANMRCLVFFICFLVDLTLGECNCGDGGLCLMYDDIHPLKAISAEPCSCDLVSKGIFITRENKCNELVDYCQMERCGKTNVPCTSGMGTFYCPCVDGWTGHRCEIQGVTWTKFVRIWYWPTRQKRWDFVLSAAQITAETKIILEFDYGQTLQINIKSCWPTSFRQLQRVFEKREGLLWSLFSNLTVLAHTWYTTDTHYICRIPMVFVPERSVWIKRVLGPVGQYHDVGVLVQDQNVTHLNATFRVYVESPDLAKECPFKFEFTGCGSDPSTAHHYGIGSQFSMSVSTVFTAQSQFCFIKYKSYVWYLAPLNRIGGPVKIGDGQTITLIPARINLNTGIKVVQVKVTFHTPVTPMVSDETVTAQCFVSLVESPLMVFIVGGDRRFVMCDVNVDVLLQSIVIRSDYARDELQYMWLCPKSLCGDADPNNENFIFNTNTPCGETHEIELVVTHPSAYSVEPSSYTVILTFVPNPYNIFLTCEPRCNKANPNVPLVITATEEPSLGNSFVWAAGELLLDNNCKYKKMSHIAIVMPGLDRGRIYELSVKTRNGSYTSYIETASGPSEIKCTIEPETGLTYVDKFNISCEVKSDAFPLLYWVYEGKGSLVIVTPSSAMNDVELTEEPVWVKVMDVNGLTSTQTLNVTLIQLSIERVASLVEAIPSRMDEIQSYLSERAYNKVSRMVGSISKLSLFAFPFAWKHRLMNYLHRIEFCDWIECVVLTADAVRRLLQGEVANNTRDVDSFILKASMTLYTLTQSLDVIALNAPTYTSYDAFDIIYSIHGAVEQCIEFVDPVLLHSFLDEDLRRMHFRKVQEGNRLARKTILALGLYVIKHIPHPSPPFKIPSRGRIKTLIVSHYLEYINCAIQFKVSSSYFQFILREMRKLRTFGTSFAVAVVNYKRNFFWWSRENTRAGKMIEVHVYERHHRGNWTVREEPFGPVYTHIKYDTEVPTKTISGRIQTSRAEKEGNVHIVRVPRGYGLLRLVFPSNLTHVLQIATNSSNLPDIDRVQHIIKSPLVNYEYRVSGQYQEVYVSVTSKSLIEYNFNYSVFRCVIWSEDQWKSELCTFDEHSLKKKYLVCRCQHISLLNLEISTTNSTLVTFGNIRLSTSLSGTPYILFLFGVIVYCILCLCVLAYYLDRKHTKMQTVIFLDDNYPVESYPYLVAVYTGSRCFSGSSSNIALRLIGAKTTSRVHILSIGSHYGFEKGEDTWFVLFTKNHLGSVDEIEIWHDSHGFYPSWYCAEIFIWDMLTSARFKFHVEAWITSLTLYSHSSNSFVVEKTLYSYQTSWKPFIFDHFGAFTRQENHWASVFILHPRSVFSRLERVSLLTVLIFVTMVPTLTFYLQDLGYFDEPQVVYRASDFRASLIAMTVSSLVMLILSWLFNVGKDKMLKRFIVGMKDKKMTTLQKIRNYFLHPVIHFPIMTRDTYLERKKSCYRIMVTAYAVSAVIIIASIAFIITVAPRFSRNNSVIWFITFSVAMVGEAVLMNPGRAFIRAVLVARTVQESRRDLDIIDVDPLEDRLPFQQVSQRLNTAIRHRVKPMYKRPLRSVLRRKARAEYRSRAFSWFHVLVVAFTFTFILIIVDEVDTILYFYKIAQLEELFTRGKSPNLVGLEAVLNRSHYFHYLKRTVLPTLHRITWYNGRLLHTEVNEPVPGTVKRPSRLYRGFCADYSTKQIGVPQLRQKRVIPTPHAAVAKEFQGRVNPINGYLTLFNEDTKLYTTKWETMKEGEVYYNFYRYWSAQKTETGPVMGPSRSWFFGGGYVEPLHWSLGTSISLLVDLELDGWLDNATRAIFFTANLYNMNVERISSVTVVTEALPSGVYWSRAVVKSAPVNVAVEQIVFLSVIGIAVVLTVYFVRSIVIMSRDGVKEHFSQTLSWLDLAMVLAGFSVLITFVNRYFIFWSWKVHSAPRDEYTSLYSFIEANESSMVCIGLLSVAVAAVVALLIHKWLHFNVIEIAIGYTRQLLFVSLVLLVIFITQVSFIIHFFGGLVIPDFFFVIFFKETTSYSTVLGPSTFAIVVFLFAIFFIVLTKMNVAVLIPFYTEAAAYILSEHEAVMRKAVRFRVRYEIKRQLKIQAKPGYLAKLGQRRLPAVTPTVRIGSDISKSSFGSGRSGRWISRSSSPDPQPQ